MTKLEALTVMKTTRLLFIYLERGYPPLTLGISWSRFLVAQMSKLYKLYVIIFFSFPARCTEGCSEDFLKYQIPTNFMIPMQ
jgi:hypothetical protein